MFISSPTEPITRTNPLLCSIKERYLLSKPGSSKETYHIVLDLNEATFPFEEGDSIGILPQNDPIRVQELLSLLSATGSEIIIDKKTSQEITLENFLLYRADLTKCNSNLTKLFTPNKETIEPADLLHKFPSTTFSLQTFCNAMMPLLPRFYSIASSSFTFPNELALTVVISTYTYNSQPRLGIASHFLCHLAHLNDTPIPIYLHKSPNFHLPENPNTPIIMVGPGTGIAPFRAFLQRRTSSKNWLFFGARNQKTDFFYEEELKALIKQGHLRLNTAFSRDQEKRIYVQHEMGKCGQELWQWIQDGAIIYICGDAKSMAKSVMTTLENIIEKEGRISDTKTYLKNLRKEKKIRLDVY